MSAVRSGRPTEPGGVHSEWRPGRWLPILYFALAHLSLATACGAVVLTPWTVVGFYYHPRMLGVVHCITLGWITSSILGATYLIVPMALRGRLPIGKGDVWAFGFYAGGMSGLAWHFWIEEWSGMAMSAAFALGGMAWVGCRFWRALSSARIPVEVKLHFRLAWLNLAGAGLLGLLLAVQRWFPSFQFLPGYVLHTVHAHAHLAALGWVAMMIMGAGYRLLPMFLPSAMPSGFWVWASAGLLEIGTLGLVVCLYLGSHLTALFAAVVVVSMGVFVERVRWMLRHRKPSPKGLRRPDIAQLHVFQALVYLGVASVLGLVLLLTSSAELKLRLVMAYGVCGLLGFFGQMVVGISNRLLPILGWFWEFSDSGYAESPGTPYARPRRSLQIAVFCLWTVAVPALAVSLALDLGELFRAGAGALLVAVCFSSANQWQALRASAAREKG